MRFTKHVVNTSLVMFVVAAGAAGTAIGASSDRSSAEPATSTPDAVVHENLSKLEDNLSEIVAQQKLERIEGAEAFNLPPGASFSGPESFESVEAQISNLESVEQGRSIRAPRACLQTCG